MDSGRVDPVPKLPVPTQPRPTLPVLETGYYERNFLAIVETVVVRYGDLLRPHEHAFAQALHALPTPARRLYIRLISRTGPELRRDRIAYDEIPAIDQAVDVLRQRAFIDTARDVTWTRLAPLLRQDELRALLRERGAPVPSRKADRLVALVESSEANADADAVSTAIRQRVHPLRPLRRDLVRLYQILFFGGLHQDWTAFVLRDLGIQRFETYALERRLRRFPDRRAIDHADALWRERLAIRRSVASGDLEQATIRAFRIAEPTRNWHPSVRPLADRVVARMASRLERAGARPLALALFTCTEAPPARERRARLLARLGREEDAIALAARIAVRPLDEQERVFAPLFVRRLLRGLDATVPPLRRRPLPREVLVVDAAPSAEARGKTRNIESPRIEAVALDALARRGQIGFFAENWLWKSLFGLAFWDIVFAPVPGVFEHPFQHAPLDLAGPDFRRHRAMAIRDRLAWLRRTPNLRPVLLRRFDEKIGIANPFVSWHENARASLAFALGRIAGGHLAWIADRLSRDPGRYRTGFPDLFVTQSRYPGFALYEVKGPGDQLRPAQRGWLSHLNAAGLEARVLDIRFNPA